MAKLTTGPQIGGGVGQGVADSTAGSWASDESWSMPEDGWIERVWVNVGGSGAGRTVQFRLYPTSTGIEVARTPGVGVGAGRTWNSAAFALSSANNNGGGNSPFLFLWGGYGFTAGFTSDGASDVGTRTGGGYYRQNGDATSAYGTWPRNPFGGIYAGKLAWYVEYWQRCTLTGIPSAPVAPGQTIDLYGRSFQAGINVVTINGVACAAPTIVDDGHMTVVVPSGATTGSVVVDSRAGTATSAGPLTVASLWVDDGAAFQPATIWVDDGTNWVQSTLWADDGTTWIQVG